MAWMRYSSEQINKLSWEDVRPARSLRHSSGGTTQAFVLFSSPCTPLKMLMWKTQSNKFAGRGCAGARLRRRRAVCVALFGGGRSTAKGPYPFTFTALTQYVCGCICVILPSRGIARNNLRKDCLAPALPPSSALSRLPRLIFNHLRISQHWRKILSLVSRIEIWPGKRLRCVPRRRCWCCAECRISNLEHRCRVSPRLFRTTPNLISHKQP